MEMIELILDAVVTMLSLGLFVLSLLSYRRRKNLKMLFVSGVFIVFFIKSLLLDLGLFYSEFSISPTLGIPLRFLDLIILSFFFIATLKT